MINRKTTSYRTARRLALLTILWEVINKHYGGTMGELEQDVIEQIQQESGHTIHPDTLRRDMGDYLTELEDKIAKLNRNKS